MRTLLVEVVIVNVRDNTPFSYLIPSKSLLVPKKPSRSADR